MSARQGEGALRGPVQARARGWATLRGVLGLVPGFDRLSRRRILARHHGELLALLEGRAASTSARPSVIYFGTTRSGSKQAAKIFLPALLAPLGLRPIDPEGFAFNGGAPDLPALEARGRLRELFWPTGYLYGPLRRYLHGLPGLDHLAVIVQLRDPRDVLVSSYFSLACSHAIPFHNPPAARRFEAMRRHLRSTSVDEAALARAPAFRALYLEYLEHLRGHPNVLWLRYEEMVTDFERWLARVITFLELTPTAAQRTALCSQARTLFQVRGEDPFRDRRQVRPGDHRRKLRARTVARLDVILADVLDHLGYARG